MGHAEFVEWLAYYQAEPFGGVRSDMQTAVVAALIANANRNPKKRKQPFKPAEFLPDWWDERRREGPQHAANLLAKFRMLAGGDDGEPEADPGADPAEPEEIGTYGTNHRDAIGQT